MHQPSREQWAQILHRARRRRAPHLRPAAQPPAVADDFITPLLVRAYVWPEDQQTRSLASLPMEAR